MEYVLNGKEAYRLFKIKALQADILKNCILYDPVSDKEIKIVDFLDEQFISESGPFDIDWLCRRDRELIFPNCTEKLLKIIEENKTPLELNKEANENFCKEHNLGYFFKAQTLEDQNTIIRVSQSKFIPSEYDQRLFFKIIKKNSNKNTKLMRWATKYFISWLRYREKETEKIHGLSRFHITYIFRHTGYLLKAISASNVIELPKGKVDCSPEMIAIIATIRAAVYLDIFELHYDPKLLKMARLANNKSFAITQSEEASSVYKRIDKFEGEILRENYHKRVNKAYKDWIKF